MLLSLTIFVREDTSSAADTLSHLLAATDGSGSDSATSPRNSMIELQQSMHSSLCLFVVPSLCHIALLMYQLILHSSFHVLILVMAKASPDSATIDHGRADSLSGEMMKSLPLRFSLSALLIQNPEKLSDARSYRNALREYFHLLQDIWSDADAHRYDSAQHALHRITFARQRLHLEIKIELAALSSQKAAATVAALKNVTVEGMLPDEAAATKATDTIQQSQQPHSPGTANTEPDSGAADTEQQMPLEQKRALLESLLASTQQTARSVMSQSECDQKACRLSDSSQQIDQRLEILTQMMKHTLSNRKNASQQRTDQYLYKSKMKKVGCCLTRSSWPEPC